MKKNSLEEVLANIVVKYHSRMSRMAQGIIRLWFEPCPHQSTSWTSADTKTTNESNPRRRITETGPRRNRLQLLKEFLCRLKPVKQNLRDLKGFRWSIHPIVRDVKLNRESKGFVCPETSSAAAMTEPGSAPRGRTSRQGRPRSGLEWRPE